MSNLTQLSEREKIELQAKFEVLEDVKIKVDDIRRGEIDEEYYINELNREMDKIKRKLNPVAVVAKTEKSTPDFEVRDNVDYCNDKYTVMEVDYNKRRYKISNPSLGETHFVSWDDKDLKKW